MKWRWTLAGMLLGVLLWWLLYGSAPPPLIPPYS